jgi:hypothetical protein
VTPGVEKIEVVVVVSSISADNAIIKIEQYGAGNAFPTNGGDASIHIDAWDPDTTITGPGTYSFITPAPCDALTTAVTATAGVTGGTGAGDLATIVIDEIWIGAEGQYPGGTKATLPIPGNNTVQPSDSVASTSWTLPEPIDTVSNVNATWRFEKENEPDGSGGFIYDPNWGAANNTATTMKEITLGAGVQIQAFSGFFTSPYTGPLADGLYSWRVDSTDASIGGGTTEGNVWLFKVGDAPPEPNQPEDQYMFLSQADGDGDSNIRTFTVTADYIDDGKSPIVDANLVNLNWNWDPDGTDGWPTNPDGEKRRGVTKISEVWTPGAGTHTAGSVTATFQTHYDAADPNYSTEIMGYWNIQLEVTDATGTAVGTYG